MKQNGWIYSILTLDRRPKQLILILADTILLLLAVEAAYSLRLEHWFLPAQGHLIAFGITAAASIACFGYLGLYRAMVRFMGQKALLSVVAGAAFSAVVLSFAVSHFNVFLPLSVPVVYFMLVIMLVGGFRVLLRSLVSVIMRYTADKTSGYERETVVIYGAGSAGHQLLTALQYQPLFAPVAFIDDNRAIQKTTISGLSVHPPKSLSNLVTQRGVTRIFLAISSASHARRAEILQFLEPFGLKVQTVPSFEDLVYRNHGIGELRDIVVEDLLGRDPVLGLSHLVTMPISDRCVMVTGAGGSIGSELCRQIVKQGARTLVLLDICEYALYRISQDLSAMKAKLDSRIKVVPILGSVQNAARLRSIISTYKVQTLYHAAAYKHVPIVEHNMIEGVRNNVLGTYYAGEAALAAGVESFVLVSSDKAVRPVNVMGASKRLAELVLQGLAKRGSNTKFSIVRFGNVLGSSGSVVPLFRDQIRSGGPVTVTHKDVIRYFMTIPEAAGLVIQAGGLGSELESGSLFLLDMGKPVNIAQFAMKMIRLMGHKVRGIDSAEGIEIVYTGLRPGEKLFEELLITEDSQQTRHPCIQTVREPSLEWSDVRTIIQQITRACDNFDCKTMTELLTSAPLGYKPTGGCADLVWHEHIQGEHAAGPIKPSVSASGNVVNIA